MAPPERYRNKDDAVYRVLEKYTRHLISVRSATIEDESLIATIRATLFFTFFFDILDIISMTKLTFRDFVRLNKKDPRTIGQSIKVFFDLQKKKPFIIINRSRGKMKIFLDPCAWKLSFAFFTTPNACVCYFLAPCRRARSIYRGAETE